MVNCDSGQKCSLPLPEGELYFLFPIMPDLAAELALANKRWEVMYVTSSPQRPFRLCQALFSSALMFPMDASQPACGPGNDAPEQRTTHPRWTQSTNTWKHSGKTEIWSPFCHSVTLLVTPDRIINCLLLIIATILKHCLETTHLILTSLWGRYSFSTQQMRVKACGGYGTWHLAWTSIEM